MGPFESYPNFPPEVEQKIHLLKTALKKTIEILKDDLKDLRAILEYAKCEVEDQNLSFDQRLKSCPHCCLVEEEKRKQNHLTYLENCLKNE